MTPVFVWLEYIVLGMLEGRQGNKNFFFNSSSSNRYLSSSLAGVGIPRNFSWECVHQMSKLYFRFLKTVISPGSFSHPFSNVPPKDTGIKRYSKPRENKGTERETRGVGWDMSISLNLFLDIV